MKRSVHKWMAVFALSAVVFALLAGCAGTNQTRADNEELVYKVYPLEREGIALHLDCMKKAGAGADKNILLVHGVTYSSHEFDINYEDYSLVRKLAKEGYCVWRLDIAGFGMSEAVVDGFMPDSDYAAEDICAAVDFIVSETGQEKIDVLGWSWGTVTVSRFAAAHPEHLNRLVLYAPILSGLGEYRVEEAFHHNTWSHAADDFQRTPDGSFDYSIIDPLLIELWCSSCWHYDGETSPNGGRRDICVSEDEKLIDLGGITVPTLIICGSKDPYLNYDLVNCATESLPEGSRLEVIEGGSHVVFVEKPYCRDFQERLIRFIEDR
ncbi:MAG: alpha/beta hydrolase [Sphaerochaetaceae bacterium]|nr:alpha/beta hydrolase [Sphaerochaetaceae bacterium]